MSAPYYHLLTGNFIIENKSPDGDSLRFISDDDSAFADVYRGYLIKKSKDRSVQLRFEGIDAPEVHYAGKAQPYGINARKQLLKLIGFKDIQYKGGRVVASKPPKIPGAILTNSLDIYGRPIAYVLPHQEAKLLNNEKWIYTNSEIIKKTYNYKLLTLGAAYFISYSSQPSEHREVMRDAAFQARKEDLGVWKLDSTTEFTLKDIDSVTVNGKLVFPKLFRRIVDFMKSVEKGYEGDLKDWLTWISSNRTRNENDKVIVDNIELYLSSLVEQRNNKIYFQGDLLNLIFIEK
ncbi:MAG: thermonuclease family protein [Patescibacteria group bacterium]